MAKVQSAKDILRDYDILKGDGKRHPNHEFQAYGYKLAFDLNDLENLKIYMRLAKNVERSLLEQAYAYAIDSNVENKAKIFLWKVKDLRLKVSHQKIINSFDYDNVIKQMTILRNDLASEIIKKNDKKFLSEEISIYKNILQNTFESLYKNKKNILFIGLDCLEQINFFVFSNVRIFGIEWAKNLTNMTKKKFANFQFSPKPKFITKDFKKNSYQDDYFDLIEVNCWDFIPLGYETIFLDQVQKISKGQILINVSQSKKVDEAWNSFDFDGKKYLYFQKKETSEHFRDLINTLGMSIKDSYRLKDDYYYLIE